MYNTLSVWMLRDYNALLTLSAHIGRTILSTVRPPSLRVANVNGPTRRGCALANCATMLSAILPSQAADE